MRVRVFKGVWSAGLGHIMGRHSLARRVQNPFAEGSLEAADSWQMGFGWGGQGVCQVTPSTLLWRISLVSFFDPRNSDSCGGVVDLKSTVDQDKQGSSDGESCLLGENRPV